jgi:hypothetical protein
MGELEMDIPAAAFLFRGGELHRYFFELFVALSRTTGNGLSLAPCPAIVTDMEVSHPMMARRGVSTFSTRMSGRSSGRPGFSSSAT